jgi:hypothetical protein
MIPFEVVWLLLATVSPVWAQNQPWANPNGSVDSRVVSCVAPNPLTRVAMDDFQFAANTNVRWVIWWGVVSGPAQLAAAANSYYIAIYANAAGPCPPVGGMNCNPAGLMASWCLQPNWAPVGMDCRNRVVYRFRVALPGAGFAAVGGVKYWLQISENDAFSANVGAGVANEDFRWSGYRPQLLCPAQQRDNVGNVICNIQDDCPMPVQTDLAYVLRSNCIGGVIAIPPVVMVPHVFLVEIRPLGAPATSPPLVREHIELDNNGGYFMDPGALPDGDYVMTIIGMGMPHFKRQFTMQAGVGSCSFFDIFYGDLDNNGVADGNDIPLMVQGLLHP